MKRKLLIILGAGSSIDQGMPSVGQLDGCVARWSAEWLRSDPALYRFDNYYAVLSKNALSHYNSRPLALGVPPSFERILGDMSALTHLMEPAPTGSALRQLICNDPSAAGLRFPFAENEYYGPYITLNSQLGYLLKRLAQYVRECSRRVDSSTRTFAAYRRLLTRLRDAFDVGIYNLNYDTVALTAWPDAFTGFTESGLFDPCAIHQRRGWNFIYHLHGSVHHTLRGSFADAIQWQHDLHAAFVDGDDGQDTNVLSDQKSFVRATLIAGGSKLDQLLVEPFHSFHAALARHVYEADAVLIGGYGFGDAHVNHALKNCLQRRLIQRPPQPVPVMILNKQDNGWAMDSRQDPWSQQMRDTLSANFFRCEVVASRGLDGFDNRIPGRSFEISDIHRVAVWHGGFLEAAEQSDRIVDFLNGGCSH